METEWKAVLIVTGLFATGIILSIVTDKVRELKRSRYRRKHRVKILKAIQRLGDD